MARYRKRFRRRKYMSKARIKSKTGAKSQANQIVSLQRQIKKLNFRTSDTEQYVQYNHQFVQKGTLTKGAPVALTSGKMTVWPIVNPSEWKGIFQSDNRTDNTNKFRGRSLGIQTQFILGNTEVPSPPMPVTMFICSLRKERGKQFLQDIGDFTAQEQITGKELDNTSGNPAIDTVNRYYSRCSVEKGATANMNSLIFLNKGVFKIHKFRKFLIGNQANWAVLPDTENYAISNIGDANKRFYDKLSYRNLLTPAVGKWKDLGANTIDPKDHLFLMIQYDKPTALETGLTVSANCVVTGITTN